MNRKVLKERGLNVLKSHYWIIVLIMAFTSFIGVENASSFGFSKNRANCKNVFSNSLNVEEVFNTSLLDSSSKGFN